MRTLAHIIVLPLVLITLFSESDKNEKQNLFNDKDKLLFLRALLYSME